MEITYELTLDYGEGVAENVPTATESDLELFIANGLHASDTLAEPDSVRVNKL